MNNGEEDAESRRRDYTAPYTSKHPIPTIQHYREEKKRREGYGHEQEDDDTPTRTQAAMQTYRNIRHGSKEQDVPAGQAYPAINQNDVSQDQIGEYGQPKVHGDANENEARRGRDSAGTEDGNAVPIDTTESTQASDLKQRRKELKHSKDTAAEREVTDPVTHLPVTIHDSTGRDIKQAPENEPVPGSEPRSSTGLSGRSKAAAELEAEEHDGQAVHNGMERLFPPPEFDQARRRLVNIYSRSSTAGMVVVFVAMIGAYPLHEIFGWPNSIKNDFLRLFLKIAYPLSAVALGWLASVAMQGWMANKMKEVWENEIWEAERHQGKEFSERQIPESTQWLNSLLASVWPLINPDLFVSLSDTLEDVMQASLPKMVRMVSVEDLGQGSESLRILGVKWLPTGAATRSVTGDGKLRKPDDGKNDRAVPGQGEVDKSESDRNGTTGDEADANKEQKKDDEQADENVAEGMEAEDGDFVNVEIAFAYRARGGGKGMRQRAKNAHMYLAFYLPMNLKFPVWVELRGLVGTARLRLQLTPDPPFFSLVTLTFLGQPKVDMSCVPLSKKGLNIMDLPLLSNFVQSAVDAAMAEYVAPKSLTLDLKDMLVGDDFKKDTAARGVLVVHIKRGYDFKQGDSGIGPLKKGSSDPYVSAGWAKFGKPVWSTRVIWSEMEPWWQETAFIPVTSQELNVDERLRMQLWDADRSTADDDLGRIEIDIKELMRSKNSNGKMWDRTDGFRALKAEEGMPGKLEWSVGYFSKVRIQNEQLQNQQEDPDVRSVEQLKDKVYKESERKLREAKKDETSEIEQQKLQDYKAKEDQMICAAPPMADYPSGILSIQLHQITGLELEAINKNESVKNEDATDETEEGDDLPSSYCTIMLNHQKVFKTRTKPKNSKPFFNAGTERFIRDWRNTEVHISVRDARVHEEDALIGVVYLPIGQLLAKRSQVNNFYPITGGVGFGRMRVSIVFRSVQLQAPKTLLGWEFGTLEVMPKAKGIGLSQELQKLKLRIRTNLSSGKMYADSKEHEMFATKRHESLKLAVRKRYSSAVVVEFRNSSTLTDKTPAFCVLWLKDIPDEEETTVTLPVYKGDLKRAQVNCIKDCGAISGEIELHVKFWCGLSGFHAPLAAKDGNLKDVMEVLDTTYDNQEDTDQVEGSRHAADASSSDSSSDEDETSGLDADGERGTVSELKDYKAHAKQLHRRNRGVMQWKGPRTVHWMKGKVDRLENKVTGLFKHHDRDTGIETEV